MVRDQAPQDVGPGLWSIVFDTEDHVLLKSGLSWPELWDIETLSSLQIVQELLDGTV